MKILALVIFVLTYASLLIFQNKRAYIALISAGIYIAAGIISPAEALNAIDWNVLMMIAGTMGIVSLFIDSKMPAFLADVIADKTPDVKWMIISLALFAGIVSAFVDNVATVLMVAPVAITVSEKLKVSPVPAIIAIAVSSNLQGAATLVGDTTSILLGGYAGLDFFDFFVFQGKPGMFWVVQAGAVMSALVLLYIFRREKQPTEIAFRSEVSDYFPSILLVGVIALLICASFIKDKPDITNGVICMTLMAVGIIREGIFKGNKNAAAKVLSEIDFYTLMLLAGLFVVVGGITEVGIVDDIADLFVKASGNIFVIYTLIVWFSVFFSAFIDNIPYIATMLPVVSGISNLLGIEPYILYFGLLAGATLGGNLTPIGASANITALGILRKKGYEVRTRDFMKISVPFTLAAVITGYVLVWILWS